jgi:hypothetical protein
MAQRGSWTGSATDLLRAGAAPGSEGNWRGRADWPKNPPAFAGRLRRAQTLLRALGIEVAFGREGRAGNRVIRMHTSPQAPSAPSAASAKDHDWGQNNLNQPVTSATINIVSIWSPRARLGRPPWRPQTILTVLTQTPPFVWGKGNGGWRHKHLLAP